MQSFKASHLKFYQPAKSSSPALPSLGTYRMLLSSNTLNTSSGSVPTTLTAYTPGK